jgi:hypothetical protein
MGNRLIVVSNRLPLTLRKAEGRWTAERSSGGLISAMNPLLRRRGGAWIGWAGYTGEKEEEDQRALLQDWADKEQCFAIDYGPIDKDNVRNRQKGKRYQRFFSLGADYIFPSLGGDIACMDPLRWTTVSVVPVCSKWANCAAARGRLKR